MGVSGSRELVSVISTKNQYTLRKKNRKEQSKQNNQQHLPTEMNRFHRPLPQSIPEKCKKNISLFNLFQTPLLSLPQKINSACNHLGENYLTPTMPRAHHYQRVANAM